MLRFLVGVNVAGWILLCSRQFVRSVSAAAESQDLVAISNLVLAATVVSIGLLFFVGFFSTQWTKP
jgi:hypothetical protein